jgi:spermidine/putrescine transport system ATP-binding protein
LQRRLGTSSLYVTHDQEEAFALSDWIVVMREGVIEQQGTPEEIYREPRNAYVADFIGGANLVGGIVIRRNGDEASIDTPIGLVAAPCAVGVLAGEVASLCIRGENLKLARAEECNSPVIAFEGTISHIVFGGRSSTLEVEVGGMSLRLILEHGDGAGPAFERTDRVRVSFDPATTWIAEGTIATGTS